jgi:hypothetical protein
MLILYCDESNTYVAADQSFKFNAESGDGDIRL